MPETVIGYLAYLWEILKVTGELMLSAFPPLAILTGIVTLIIRHRVELKRINWAVLDWRHPFRSSPVLRDTAFETLYVCISVFFVTLLVWAPYQYHVNIVEHQKTELLAQKTKLEDNLKSAQRKYEQAEQEKSQKIEKLQQSIESLKPKENPVIAKLCFNEPLQFSQIRLARLPQNTPTGFDYAKEVKMPEFSTSGTTRLRIHVTGRVGWIEITPKEKEDGASVRAVGDSYVELSLTPQTVHARHWHMTLFSEKPFDVICIDRLPIRPRQD